MPSLLSARPRPLTLAAWLLALIALLLAAWLLWRRPPALARLLPEADAIVYADLRPVHLLTKADAHPVAHSAEYQQFIDSTGIVPERDLRQAAFALHRMADPGGPNGLVGYSELFTGRFDAERLATWLRSVAAAQESYAGREIFSIAIALPLSSPKATPAARTLRVAVLDGNTVAASNMPTAEQMHAMLDRARGPRLFASGPSLLTATYAELPAGALAWGVGQLALPLAETGRVTALGLSLPVPANQPMLASLRYTTALHLQVELLAGSDAAAQTQADALRGLLDLARAVSLGNNAVPAPKAAADLLRSVTVTPEHDRTLIRAEVPASLLRMLSSGATAATSSGAQPGAFPSGPVAVVAR